MRATGVSVASLAALAPVGLAVPSLVLSAAAALVVVLLALWDAAAYLGCARPSRGIGA